MRVKNLKRNQSNAFRINTSAICPILDPLGNVVFVPFNTQTYNVQTYNPVTNQASNVVGTRLNAGTGSFGGGVLLPNGNIAFIPADISNVCLYNPFTQVLSNALRISTLADKFRGGALTPDGNVVCVPYSNPNVCVVNVLSPPYTLTNVAHGVTGGVAWYGGVTIPNGNVILVNSFSSGNIGMVDPVAMTYSNVRTTGTGWRHGTLLPDGRVVFGSYNTSNIGVLSSLQPISREFCRSPYFNKF